AGGTHPGRGADPARTRSTCPRILANIGSQRKSPLPNPPPRGRELGSIAQLEVLEAFRNREGLTGGLLGRPLTDCLLQFGPLADLALMLAERFELQVDGLADVNPDIGLVRAGQVDLPHVVRLQSLVKKLGQNKARVRVGDDGVQRGLVRGAMVGMVDVALTASAWRGVGRD